MVQRVGNNYNLLIVKQAIALNREQHTRAMEPIATGRKINHLSDDPSRLSEFFRVSNDAHRVDQYTLNISTAQTRINITDSVLNEANKLVQEAYEIGLRGNVQTLNQVELESIGQRLTDIKSELLDLANTKVGNNYLFSGYKFTTKPFTGTPVVYGGDSNIVYVKVTAQKNIQVSLNGDNIFTGGGAGKDIFATLDNLIVDIAGQDEVQVGADITDLQDCMAQILEGRTTLGNSGQSLDTATSFLQQLSVTSAERLGEIADIDLAKATTELQFYEFTLKSAFAVTQRVMQITTQSFFDF